MRIRLTAAAVLASGATLCAQDGEIWQPEIRRAIPVEKPAPTPAVNPQEYPNPDWMKRVKPALPVEPADAAPAAPQPGPEPGFTPFRPQGRIQVDPTPVADEKPIPRAIPVHPESIPEPPAVPATPEPPAPAAVSAPSAPVPAPVAADEDGDIRLSPAPPAGDAAAEGALNLANSVYARKMYDYAIGEYEKFLISYPSANGRDMALYRLAECHRMLGNEDAARAGYEKLVMEFREGAFAGAGAYRLGEYLFAEKKYEPAMMQFEVAATQASEDEVRLSAKYNLARALDRLKRPADAAKVYREVAAVEQNNPYRDYARLSLAESSAAAGKKDDALAAFAEIANASGEAGAAPPAAVRAEACVKAAALAAELGDKPRALKLFNQALELKELGDWKSVAYLGSMRLSYDLGDYKKVAAASEKMPEDLPDEARAELLLMAGNSYRQLDNVRAARAIYDRLLILFPDAAPSQDARFHRLLSMYQLNDPGLLKEADEFLQRQNSPKERAQVLLIKAETLFKQQKFAEAGPIYAQLDKEPEVSADLKAKALYKLGWCQAQTGDHPGAIATYTTYIEKNADSPTLPSAIVQRGLAYQQTKDYAAAIKDFDTLIEKFPKATERELALQQKALVLGQQQEYKGMITAFKQLLAEYPKSPGAGQANFWIGWAAFEDKDYKGAIESLEAARKLDPTQYGERSNLRILLCYYYLQDRAALVEVITANKGLTVPVEITRWLGRQSFEEGDYASAERYLLPVVSDPKAAEPDVLIEMAEAQIRLGKQKDATAYVEKYLSTAREPYSRARGLQAKAAIALGNREMDAAAKLCEESLLLQPEGRLNAEGRLLGGEIAFARGDFDGAARAFMTVAVLYDDATVTPRALRRAADAYRKADNLLEADKALHELQQRFPDFQKTPKISKDNR